MSLVMIFEYEENRFQCAIVQSGSLLRFGFVFLLFISPYVWFFTSF